MGKNVKRLYTEFQPEQYSLHLHPDKKTKTFTGTVAVTGRKVGKPSQRLTFHQNGLKITETSIVYHDKKGDQELAVPRVNHHAGFDEVRLHATQKLYPGTYTVTMKFKGKITRPMNGMYPCFFRHKGEYKEIIATQFESHHAREVFPCIDEPEAKATFDLHITSPKGETVLSNTPVKSQEEQGGLVTTHFELTPIMSTYLLAFVIGELAYKEAQTKDGVTVRTYAVPHHIDATAFALDVAVKSLEFYNDYFAIPYPLKKLDMVALPDFASGAMENWGLITYREQTMLVDPKHTPLSNKQYVAMVVAHELAHQWFGNLVTMRWWTDLWLNEGFASWIEYMAVDHLFPEWQMWTQFIVDEQHRALKLDALEHTHPIEVPVRHPDEIRTIFDTISYSKGASVIHMLHQYLEPEPFRNGLRHYLHRHRYGNTDTIDLWQALEEISEKPVKDFMQAWTKLPGFPLLKAEVTDNEIRLSQERFYLNPSHQKATHQTWPIALLTQNSAIDGVLLEPEKTIKLKDSHDLKINRGQSGFYRTTYNASHLERLATLIKKGQLGPLDRLGVLSDVFETAKAGKTDTVDALHLLEAFSEENDNAVWDTIAAEIVSVRSVMDDEALRDLMKPFIRRLVRKEIKRLGWEPNEAESHFDSLLRPTVLGLAAGADDPSTVKKCRELFTEMEKPENIHPDIRGVVYTAAARHGDAAVFDKLFAMHEATTLSDERTTIAAALTSFKQPKLIDRSLTLITSPSVRLQDVSYWIAYSFSNRFARQKTWEWMKDHWEWLAQNLGTDMSFTRFPMYAANAFSSKPFIDEFKTFFIPRKTPAFERSVNQGIEILEWKSTWKERDFAEIKTFFTNRQNQ